MGLIVVGVETIADVVVEVEVAVVDVLVVTGRRASSPANICAVEVVALVGVAVSCSSGGGGACGGGAPAGG